MKAITPVPLILAFLLVLLTMPTAISQGSSMDTAEPITPGTITADGKVSDDPNDFYEIDVSPGQRLVIEAEFSGDQNRGGYVYLYDEDKEKIGWVSFDEVVKRSFLPGTADGKTKISIEFSGWSKWHHTTGYSADIILADSYDGNKPQDAGDTYDDALPITPGSYPSNWLSATGVEEEMGTDEKDIFSVSLAENEKLALRITPPDETEFKVSIIDIDRTTMAGGVSANPGAILKAEIVSIEGGQYYIVVEEDRYSGKKGGKYAIEIHVSNATEEEISEQELLDTFGIPRDGSIDPQMMEMLRSQAGEMEGALAAIRAIEGLDDGEPISGEDIGNLIDTLGEEYEDMPTPEELEQLQQDVERGIAIAAILIIAIPILGLISLILFIICAISIFTAKNTGGWKAVWFIVVFLLPILGPIIYFIGGKRGRKKTATPDDRSSSTQPSTPTEQSYTSPPPISQPPPLLDPRVQQVRDYVSKARSAGKTDDETRQTLKQAGWPDDLINQGF
ncbi:MAG: PLD nuclease N-terminal domain-containing protein [archaeon]